MWTNTGGECGVPRPGDFAGGRRRRKQRRTRRRMRGGTLALNVPRVAYGYTGTGIAGLTDPTPLNGSATPV